MGAKVITQEEKDKILELFNKGYNRIQISKIIGRHPSSVSNYIKSLGMQFSLNTYDKKITEEEILKMIEMYKDRKSCATIKEALNLKISENTMVKILRERNVEVRPRGHIPFYIEKEDFFENIDCEEKAYLLGLLIADGYILKREKKSAVWGISLKKSDSYLLEKIKEYIGIKEKKIVNDRDNCDVLSISSEKMVSDLSKYGVVERKSSTVKLPTNIREDLMRHLIRGIFDGDGTAFINCNDRMNFGFYGNNNIVSEIKTLLRKELNLADNKITDKETVSQLTFSQKDDLVNFYNYIYKDSNVWMVRKKEMFEKHFENNFK